MMNRRLRERLTEAEILQIFVDVCEVRDFWNGLRLVSQIQALACMHNLKPPLLHRDLKARQVFFTALSDLAEGGECPPSGGQQIQAL